LIIQTLDSFQPPFLLKNAHVQTFLGSSKLRALAPNIMREVAREEIIKTSEGLFPDLYDFEDVMDLKTIQELTDVLLEKYSDFQTARDYFQAYSVMGSAIEHINTPTTIITAEDDPIIPIKDFYDLKLNKHIQLIVHSYGGHNGFITGFKLQSWYENKIIKLFDQICGNREAYYE